jgi:hypothetical protein
MRAARFIWAVVALVALVACGGGTEEGTTTTRAPPPSTAEPGDPSTAEPGDPSWGEIEEDYEGEGPRVVVLGDSLTVQSRNALGRELAGYALKVAALRGEGLSGGPLSDWFDGQLMLGAARSYANDDPAIAVLALGTNDAWSADLALPPALEAWRTMTGLFDAACIVGVTITESSSAPDYSVDEARAINEVIVAGSDELVDWRELGAPVTRPDGIHPTLEGVDRLAGAIRRAVDAC